MIQEIFGNRIKEIRKLKMISQMELSKLSGIERTQISKIEKGKINVTLRTMQKISRAMDIQIGALINFQDETSMKPFLKWAGGKTQILNKIIEYMPETYDNYFEPFVGGGALLLHLAPKKAYINDSNMELIFVYKSLQDDNLFNEFINKLSEHEQKHNEEYYYEIRALDRTKEFKDLPIYERAARMVYLNKTCFNGLYRVNSKGFFNVPSAKKNTVKTYDRENMKLLKRYFSYNQINVLNTDFEEAVKEAKEGDFVYFDPPYDILDNKASFTSYSKNSFGKEEQARLVKVFKELSNIGVKVMLSNHNTQYINELYKEFNIYIVKAKRMINSKADGRGEVEEVIITNY